MSATHAPIKFAVTDQWLDLSLLQVVGVKQAGGLTDGSRRSERSGDLRTRREPISGIPPGCCRFGGLTGGLRKAPTPGYLLAPLRGGCSAGTTT
jgi:hypothetical protein